MVPGLGWPWALIRVRYYEYEFGEESYISRYARFVSLVDEPQRNRRAHRRSYNKRPMRDGPGSDRPLPLFLAFADAAYRRLEDLRKWHSHESVEDIYQRLADWIATSERPNGWEFAAMGYRPEERHLPLVYTALPDPWAPDARDRQERLHGHGWQATWPGGDASGADSAPPRPARPEPVRAGEFPSADRHLRERGLTGIPRGPDDDLDLGSRGTFFDMQAAAADPDEPGRVGPLTRFREGKRVVFRNATAPNELFPGAPAREICICWQWQKDPLAKCRFAHGRRGGCFNLHRCSFIGEDGWPCQNAFPCRAIEHYWLYVETYGRPPRWYNPTAEDLAFCEQQEELRLLSRPQGIRPGEYTYAHGDC